MFLFLGSKKTSHSRGFKIRFFSGTIKQATRDLVPNAAGKKCVCGQGVEKYDIKTFEVERVFFLGLLCLASTVDVLWDQPIKLIQVVSTFKYFMNIDGITLFLFFSSPSLCAGPQK